MVLPVPAAVPVLGGRLLSRQGPRAVRRFWHNGTDWSEDPIAPGATLARAIASGVVVEAARSGRHHQYGNVVAVRHSDDALSIYAHLDRILVAEGMPVLPGQPIGIVGSTFGTEEDPTRRLAVPHLHLEVVRNWPLGSRDHAARYDVLHELASSGIVLSGSGLVAGEPRNYYEPALLEEEAKAGASSDLPDRLADPALERPGPGWSSRWAGPLVVGATSLGVLGILCGTVVLHGRMTHL